MQIDTQIYLIDKNNDEQELILVLEFDGEITRNGVSTFASQETLSIVSIEFAEIPFTGLELLLDYHFPDNNILTVWDMISEAANGELEHIFEEQYLQSTGA